MQAVILAGGKGTRLGIKDIPKPMVTIAGNSLLQYQIELVKRYNITDIFILSGFLANVIIDYFGDGSAWGVKIHHIVEPEPLGTAGALKLLENKLNDRFLVLYGDIVMDFDISFFIDYDKCDPDTIGTILVHPNDHPYDSDLVEVDKEKYVKSFLPKPHSEDMIYNNLVSAAVYILSPKIMKYIEVGTFADFGKDIFPLLIKENEKLKVYKSSEYIKDMGTKDRLEEVSRDFENGRVKRFNRTNKRPGVFLNSDIVINKKMDKNISFDKFDILSDVVQAIKRINKSDYLCIVGTNQPIITESLSNLEDFEFIHKKMETDLGKDGAYLDGIYFYPNRPEKEFSAETMEIKNISICKKPKPVMFLKACEDFNIDPYRSWIIGNSPADILAGESIGCKTIIVGRQSCPEADYQCIDITEAVQLVLNN